MNLFQYCPHLSVFIEEHKNNMEKQKEIVNIMAEVRFKEEMEATILQSKVYLE